MKFSRLMLAVAALGASHAAMAAGNVNLTGASASTINITKALNTLCTNGGGSATVYKSNNTSLSSLGNVFTVVCSGGQFGTNASDVDVVRVNVGGGSASAITNVSGYGSATTFLDHNSSTCADLAAGSGALSFLAAGKMKNCTTAVNVTEFSSGGHMDVEGSIFSKTGVAIPAAVNAATDYVASGFQQAFGVAVSTTLYSALQNYQKVTGELSASCTTGDTTIACQPSISKADLASFMKSGLAATNAAKTAGASWLTPVANGAQIASGTQITWCRRPGSSGTQASAQLYFLNLGGTGDLGGALAVDGSATAPATVTRGNLLISTNSGSSDVKTCLNGASNYAFGSLSLENIAGSSDTFKYVKVSGTSSADGVSNTTNAINGSYDYVYTTYKFCPAGTCAKVLNDMDTALTAGASSPGLFLTSEARYTRGSKSTLPYTVK